MKTLFLSVAAAALATASLASEVVPSTLTKLTGCETIDMGGYLNRADPTCSVSLASPDGGTNILQAFEDVRERQQAYRDSLKK